MSFRKHLQLLRNLADEFSSSYKIEKTKNGHFAVILEQNGNRATVFAPSTPSDHRSMLNVRTKLKRAAAELRTA